MLIKIAVGFWVDMSGVQVLLLPISRTLTHPHPGLQTPSPTTSHPHTNTQTVLRSLSTFCFSTKFRFTDFILRLEQIRLVLLSQISHLAVQSFYPRLQYKIG